MQKATDGTINTTNNRIDRYFFIYSSIQHQTNKAGIGI